MKKFVTIFLAAALSLSMLAVGTSADEQVVKKGTPVVDGVLDDIYTGSLTLKDLGTAPNAYETEWDGSCTADIYALWDDTYLYLCGVVRDDDILTKGEEFAKTDAYPHINDCIEFRVSLDGNPTETIKFVLDAYGYACTGLEAHYMRLDYSTVKWAVTRNETSYTVEAAVPCTKGELDMIKSGKLGLTYQLNDIDEQGKATNHTTSFNGEAAKMPVFYNLSDELAVAAPAAPVETTAAPVETTAAPAETTAAPAETTAAPVAPSAPTTAPSTFDPAIIAVALTAASGAAFVLASKKH